MAAEPVVIRRTATVEEAQIIVAWLDEQGVEAVVVDQANPGVFAFGVTDIEGIAIAVPDEESARRAESILAEHDREHAEATLPDTSIERVDVVCETCKSTTTFTGEQRGTVQECSECGAYLDVPERA
jgi:hypothetical protein